MSARLLVSTTLAAATLGLALAHGCSPTDLARGTERAPCNTDGTCEPGLSCFSLVCVDVGIVDAGGPTPCRAPIDSKVCSEAGMRAGDGDRSDAADGQSRDAGKDSAAPVAFLEIDCGASGGVCPDYDVPEGVQWSVTTLCYPLHTIAPDRFERCTLRCDDDQPNGCFGTASEIRQCQANGPKYGASFQREQACLAVGGVCGAGADRRLYCFPQ